MLNDVIHYFKISFTIKNNNNFSLFTKCYNIVITFNCLITKGCIFIINMVAKFEVTYKISCKDNFVDNVTNKVKQMVKIKLFPTINLRSTLVKYESVKKHDRI
jgi:hypothetical protein